MDSIQCIENMRISRKEVSRFHIPLCKMVYMPLVRSTLANDIKRLEAEFIHGYRPRASMFYVSICNKHGYQWSMQDEDTSKLAYTEPQLTMNLRPNWFQNLTLSSFMIVCFIFVMGTIGSRHGWATLTSCIVMNKSGIIQ